MSAGFPAGNEPVRRRAVFFLADRNMHHRLPQSLRAREHAHFPGLVPDEDRRRGTASRVGLTVKDGKITVIAV